MIPGLGPRAAEPHSLWLQTGQSEAPSLLLPSPDETLGEHTASCPPPFLPATAPPPPSRGFSSQRVRSSNFYLLPLTSLSFFSFEMGMSALDPRAPGGAKGDQGCESAFCKPPRPCAWLFPTQAEASGLGSVSGFWVRFWPQLLLWKLRQVTLSLSAFISSLVK